MNPTPTPLASTAMEAAATAMHDRRNPSNVNLMIPDAIFREYLADAETAFKHFQSLLAKVEEKNAELMGCLEKADRDEDKAITERDAAEDVADQLTSAILGEDIDWPDHGEKWQEAIESVPELLSLRADLAAKEAALREAIEAGTYCVDIVHASANPKSNDPVDWKGVALHMYAAMNWLPKARSALASRADKGEML